MIQPNKCQEKILIVGIVVTSLQKISLLVAAEVTARILENLKVKVKRRKEAHRQNQKRRMSSLLKTSLKKSIKTCKVKSFKQKDNYMSRNTKLIA
jgi:hypothetical protein